MSDDFFRYAPAPPAAEPEAAPAAPAEPALPELLADLTDADWEPLLGVMARRRYPAGSPVWHAGAAPALVWLLSGHLQTQPPGAQAAPRLVESGAVLGLLSFLDGQPSAVDVTALTDSELLMLTPQALQQLAAWQPALAMRLLRELAAQVAARLRRLQPGD